MKSTATPIRLTTLMAEEPAARTARHTSHPLRNPLGITLKIGQVLTGLPYSWGNTTKMTTFWQGKRVAVLGGAGFLGSHVVDLLLSRGSVVAVLDNFSRGTNENPAVANVEVDAGSLPALYSIMAVKPWDVVLNLAASVAGVLYNQTHNSEMFSDNVALQSIPVQVCADLKVPRFIQVSSVCVYAPEYAAGAVEESGQLGEPVQANNGYAWAKRMGERVALWADLPSVSIVRPSNMYGPRDYFDDKAHVIPALIKKCLTDDVIEVHGTGDEVREFLYVEDAARGLLAVAEHGAHRGVYNLGTGGVSKTSISNLVKSIQAVTRTLDKPVKFMGGNAGDKERYSNCEKIESLGFLVFEKPMTGLEKTVEWYQSTRETA